MADRKDTVMAVSNAIPALQFITASSTPTTSLSTSEFPSTFLQLSPSQTCWLAFGPAPVAAVNSGMRLPANAVITFEVSTNWQIAAIGETVAGTLSIVRMK